MVDSLHEPIADTGRRDASSRGAAVLPHLPAPTARQLVDFMPGNVRLQTLVLLRWLAVGGQFVAIFVINYALGYPLPLAPCFAAIAASALVNAIASLRAPATKRLSPVQTALFLAFDIVQLSVLLAMTGGLDNPFALLVLAPVVVAASTVPWRLTAALLALAMVSMTLIAIYHWPLPWEPDVPFKLPNTYVWGIWCALMLGMSFTAAYAWRIAMEARRMSNALAATQDILSREHQMSALGGLAAAAAHELGTPLATIALVAKELRRALPKDGAVAEDIQLMVSQVERCREILSRLSVRPDQADSHVARVQLGVLLEEVVAPHRGFGIETTIELKSKGAEPIVARSPELLHALGNLVENAVDFARSAVRIEASWDKERVTLTIADDGPGFALSVIDRLGEPYLTTRAAPTNLRPVSEGDEGPQGMGLGFFIAKTLIERIGGALVFGNRGGRGGAVVTIAWPRPPDTGDVPS